MHLIIPRNDEKRMVHLNQLVKMATKDIQRGEETMPRALYDKLNALSVKFYDTYRKLGQCNGRKMMAVAERNKTTQRLCYLVRDVYVMARRKYERGDYGDHLLAQHGIPKTVIRDNAQQGIWITLAEEILAGDAQYTQKHPTILRDPTREDLETAKEAACKAHREFHAANTRLGTIQIEMQYLRKQATSLLLSARHAISASFFELSGPNLREVLFAYGYRFKPAPVKKESGLIKLKPTQKPKSRRKRQTRQDHAFNYTQSMTMRTTTTKQAEPTQPSARKTEAQTPATPTINPESQAPPAPEIKTQTPTKPVAKTADPPIKAEKTAATQKPKTKQHHGSTKTDRQKKKAERQNRRKSRKRN